MDYAVLDHRNVVVNILVGPLPNGMVGIPIEDDNIRIGDEFRDGVLIPLQQRLDEAEFALGLIQEAING